MTEIWKDIKGYENLYEISNYGRVRTHKNKTTWTERHGTRHWKQIYLKEKNPKGRDCRVSLWKDGKVKDYLVHRLVAFAFIPNDDITRDCINHIDGNPKNNHVENLEWCNYKENSNHAFDNELMRCNNKVVLLRLKDNKRFNFRSMTKASHFLGKSHGYISDYLKKGKSKQLRDKENNIYKIELEV